MNVDVASEDVAPAKIVYVQIARSLHETFWISISDPRSLQDPSPFGFLSLCAVYPATFVAALHSVVLQSRYPSPSRIRFILYFAHVRKSWRYIVIFCRFYFREHLVAALRTKRTCSLRKFQEARGWLAGTQLSLFTCF